jgi:hypothetical protein
MTRPDRHDVVVVGARAAGAATALRLGVTVVGDRSLTAPAPAERLARGRRTAPVTGMLRGPHHIRRAYGPGWAHGRSDAYRDDRVLAAA